MRRPIQPVRHPRPFPPPPSMPTWYDAESALRRALPPSPSLDPRAICVRICSLLGSSMRWAHSVPQCADAPEPRIVPVLKNVAPRRCVAHRSPFLWRIPGGWLQMLLRASTQYFALSTDTGTPRTLNPRRIPSSMLSQPSAPSTTMASWTMYTPAGNYGRRTLYI